MLLKYHIGCFDFGLLCVGIWVLISWGGIRVVSAGNPDTTPADPHPTPTHNKPRTKQPMW